MMDTAGNPLPLQARVHEGHADCMHDVPVRVDDGGRGGFEERMKVDRVNIMASCTSELTISFKGQVHVFPTVTTEKVEAVLLLLGEREIPRSIPTSEFLLQESKKIIGDASQLSDLSPRTASLVRFRKKRKERCFEKKIRYSCRKEVAERMRRKKGQFVSSKESYKPAADGNSDSGDCAPQPEHICQHCGVGEKSTPAMRKGPAGPRTLCNACGLTWRNKGTLRDLTKRGRSNTFNQSDTDTPNAKRSTMEQQNSCNDHYKEASLEEKKAPLMMDSGNHSDLRETAEGVTDDSVSDTLEELANTSGTEFDISMNFDEEVDIDSHMGTNWPGI